MKTPTPFHRELLTRFSGSVAMSSGEVWVRYEDAVPVVDLAQERGLNLLGMEGFVVGKSVYPSMSRIADFSRQRHEGSTYDDARALLTGPWAQVPDDLHSEAAGIYMIDVCVDDRPSTWSANGIRISALPDDSHTPTGGDITRVDRCGGSL